MISKELLFFLACPFSKQSLIYDAEKNQLISKAAQCAFPVENGVPVLLKERAIFLEENK